jgi:hypothetical protein
MKAAALALIMALSLPTVSSAALPRDCAELEAAHAADVISQYDDECYGDGDCESRQILQLREAAKERDSKYDPTMTDEQLARRYGAGRRKLVIGTDVFDGVALFVDFVWSLSFFDTGSTTRAPISHDDGVTILNGKTCHVPLAPILSAGRKKNLCLASIEYIRSEEIGTQIEIARCLDSEFRIENLSDDTSTATILFTRENPKGDVDLLCVGTVDRATDEVSGVECMIPE